MSDTFAALATSLAGFGIDLHEKVKLTFAPLVLKALSTVPKDSGRVVVLCNGTPEAVSKRFANLSDDERKVIAVVTCNADYAKVRPHVLAPFRTRKIPHGITLAMKDSEGNAYGFGIIRK
jgi:hypothetical protein